MTSRKITSVPLLLALAAAIANAQAQFAITNSSFPPNGPIGATFTCSGANHSPALEWSGAPAATRSYAIIVADPDAPGGTFIHWVAYNIPTSVTKVTEDVPKVPEMPGGGVQGMNGAGRVGYFGPCPPPGKVHHYHFSLFALDSMLSVGTGADAEALEAAMKGHIIAQTEVMGTYSR
ncbi:MAG TPA: YbhB/YbcL family Raf kinase inhibitor-like protein [Candidatus Binataceae bacterium]